MTESTNNEQMININGMDVDNPVIENKEPEGESILKYIKPEISQQLQEMGFSKNVSEKACFFNQNILEKAIEWIYEHQNDFEEELRIIGQENKPKLSDEEIKQKAKELQEYARKRYIEKQRLLEEEQERSRIRQTKDLMKAKRDMDDAEMRRQAEIQKNKKKETELEKKRMLEQLARDKEERFGKKFDPSNQSELKKEYSPYDNVEYFMKAIKTLYPTFRAGDTLKNCFNTLKVILINIAKNPTEEKFRKVKTTNPNFEERVGKIQLAMKILHTLGFEEEGEFLIAKNPDINLFAKSAALFEDEVSKL